MGSGGMCRGHDSDLIALGALAAFGHGIVQLPVQQLAWLCPSLPVGLGLAWPKVVRCEVEVQRRSCCLSGP